jgi:hypothetical protein
MVCEMVKCFDARVYNRSRYKRQKTKAGVLSTMGIPREEAPAGRARDVFLIDPERVFLMLVVVLTAFSRLITCKHERRSLHVAGSPCPHIPLLFRPGATKKKTQSRSESPAGSFIDFRALVIHRGTHSAHDLRPRRPLVGC